MPEEEPRGVDVLRVPRARCIGVGLVGLRRPRYGRHQCRRQQQRRRDDRPAASATAAQEAAAAAAAAAAAFVLFLVAESTDEESPSAAGPAQAAPGLRFVGLRRGARGHELGLRRLQAHQRPRRGAVHRLLHQAQL